MAYENKLCWRWKHSNMNIGHDCCGLLFSTDLPLRITVPELTHFTRLFLQVVVPPLSFSVLKCAAYQQLQFHLCLLTKAHSQGDSDYTCLTLTRCSGHAAFCRLWIRGETTWKQPQRSLSKLSSDKLTEVHVENVNGSPTCAKAK